MDQEGECYGGIRRSHCDVVSSNTSWCQVRSLQTTASTSSKAWVVVAFGVFCCYVSSAHFTFSRSFCVDYCTPRTMGVRETIGFRQGLRNHDIKKKSSYVHLHHAVFSPDEVTQSEWDRSSFLWNKLVTCHRQQFSFRCLWNTPARHGRRLSVTALAHTKANLLKCKWELIACYNCFSLSPPSCNTCQMFSPHLLLLVLLKTSANEKCGTRWTMFWPC